MNIIEIIVLCIIAIASLIYIGGRWRDAVRKRDAEWMFRPLAGVYDDENEKPSAFRYFFK